MKKKKKLSKMEFSKRMVVCVLAVSVIDVQMCIVFDRSELGIAIVTEIVAVALGYFLKAFFAKREEENMSYKRDRFIDKEDNIE